MLEQEELEGLVPVEPEDLEPVDKLVGLEDPLLQAHLMASGEQEVSLEEQVVNLEVLGGNLVLLEVVLVDQEGLVEVIPQLLPKEFPSPIQAKLKPVPQPAHLIPPDPSV